jgi:hypothetical protein
MSGRQRLLLGFFAGGVITLLAIGPSRSFLLHVLHRPSVESAISKSVLSGPSGPIIESGNPAQMDLAEVTRQTLVIAQRIYRDPNATISTRDFEIANEYLNRGEALEGDNAYWPQLRAAIAHRADKSSELIWSELRRAAEKRYWSSGSMQETVALWSHLAASEGMRMSWQGLLAREMRADDPAYLILEIERLVPRPSDTSDDAWRKRYLIAWNFSILRDGARTVEVTDLAASAVLRISDSFVVPGSERTLAAIEQSRASFVSSVFEKVGELEGDRTGTAVRNSVARSLSFMPSNEIFELRDMLTLRSIIVCSLPSVLFVGSLLMLGLALIGWLISKLFGDIPHPDFRFSILLGVVGGAVCGVLSGAWLFGLWIAFVITILGIPMESPLPDKIEWNRLNRVVLGTLTAIVLISACLWLFAEGPTALLASRSLLFISPLLDRPDLLGLFAVVTITFLAPASVLWAQIKRRSPLRVFGEAIIRVGGTAAIVGISASVLLTPITIYTDSKLSNAVDRWVRNETDAFRIAPR